MKSCIRFGFCYVFLLLPLLAGCWSSHDHEVVVFTAQDEEYAKPIFEDFKKTSGVPVLPQWDSESTKTVGLATAIEEQSGRAHPLCDVFWNNEILLTMRLAKKGLLEVYRPKVAESYPAMYRSKDGLWCGFAARARILLVSKKLPPEKRPKSIIDLTDPRFKGRIGMAKPLFGTTATQAACLFALWGDEKARAFYDKLKANDVKILSGNKQVAEAVSSGEIDFGMTDTDDATEEIRAGRPVEIIYPDQGPDEPGTLYIPNALAIIKNTSHQADARKLVDYLLSPEIEGRLAEGPSAQVPLNPEVTVVSPIKSPKQIRAMQVDFEKAADKWDEVSEYFRKRFAL